MPITVLIADDSAVMRKAVKIFLNSRTDFAIIGEATSCAETTKLLKDLRPDVLLFDLHMQDSFDQPMAFREYLHQTKIVAMTLGTDEIAKALAEHIGANVLVDKADLTTELIPLVVGLMQKS
jgi:DNA-binding NarL/FixJ family response regulator